MRLIDFEAMVRRLSAEVPAHFFDGVAEVVVSPRTVPHPSRPDIFTLGECISVAGDAAGSRIVLYHGSFRALAQQDDDFDWRDEAWETLTHELRHHLEARAHTAELEAFDDAAEHNFARHEGELFDPGFHLDAEPVGEDRYRVDDDWFIDRLVRHAADAVTFSWRERSYEVTPPAGTTLPAFLTVSGVADPPAGDLVLVLRRRPRLRDLLRRPLVFQAKVSARPIDDAPTG